MVEALKVSMASFHGSLLLFEDISANVRFLHERLPLMSLLTSRNGAIFLFTVDFRQNIYRICS